MFSMDKIMNLIYNFAVLNYTTISTITSYNCVLDRDAVEYMHHVRFLLVSDPTKGFIKLQDPNLNFGIVKNVGCPKFQKKYGYGGIIVGKMLFNSSRFLTLIYSQRFYAMTFKREFIELPKGFSFKPSKDSPLNIVEGENKVTFYQMNSSSLIYIICHPDVLFLAYELIKYNKDKITLRYFKSIKSDIIANWISEISKKLQSGQYHFSTITQNSIIENKKCFMFPYFFYDIIVQKALTIVIFEFYEQTFLEYSHGFHTGRNYQTALKMVKQNFQNSNWFIKFNLTQCLDNINSIKILKLLGNYITCSVTLALISSSFKTNAIIQGKNIIKDALGISTKLITNIYLHELDLFIKKLLGFYIKNKTHQKKSNFNYIKYKIIKFYGLSEVQKSLKRLLDKHSTKKPNKKNLHQLVYVRYSNEFVIGVSGFHKSALILINQVKSFLINSLELNPKDILLKKFSQGVNFLNYFITNKKLKERPFYLLKYNNSKNSFIKNSYSLKLHLPIFKLLDQLATCGYYVWNRQKKRVMPTASLCLVNQKHNHIILLYNSIILDILSFYSIADNRKAVGSLIHGLKWSCNLTLALKHKLRTSAKTYKTFGAKLSCPDNHTYLYMPKSFTKPFWYKNIFNKYYKINHQLLS